MKSKHKEFFTSLIFYLVLGSLLSYILYNIDTPEMLKEDNRMIKSIIFGFIGAISVFFVPYLYKRIKKP